MSTVDSQAVSSFNAIFADGVVNKDEFIDQFKRYDRSGDGVLAGDELTRFCDNLADTDRAREAALSSGDFVEVFTNFYDAKGDSAFTIDELVEALNDFVRPEEPSIASQLDAVLADGAVGREEFYALFKKFDHSGDSVLAGDELKRFCDHLAETERAREAELSSSDFVEVFTKFYDAKSDNQFTLDEILDALRDFVRPEEPSIASQLNVVFRDGVVSKDEFLVHFKKFDHSGDGVLAGDELKRFCDELAATDLAIAARLSSDDFVEVFVSFYDEKGDEAFSVDELIAALDDFVRPRDS